MKTESAIIAGVAVIALVLGAFAIYQTMTLNQQLDTANSKITTLQNDNNALQSTDNTLNSELTSAINNITALQASYNSLENNYTTLNTQLGSITNFLKTWGYGETVSGSMSVPSFSITGAQTVTVYVENTGTKILTLNANSAYIDGLAATINTPAMPLSLGIGATQTLTLTSTGAAINDGSAHSLKIVAADGTTVAISIASPS